MPRKPADPTAAPKTKGIKVRIDAFLPIDQKSYAAKRDAYALMEKIDSGDIPEDLFDRLTIIKVDAKEGSVDLAPTE